MMRAVSSMQRLLGIAACALALAARAAHADAPPAPPPAPPPVVDLDLDAAYDRLLARPHPRYLLPALENVLAVTGGLVWYWLDRERQVADWDFPSIKQRFTLEAWRYDNNPFPINFAWHAVDGGQYHVFARASDLSLLASVGYGVGTSLLWEFGVEFREKVSINDVIVTTAGGTVIGEVVHWLGRYFESAPAPRWWHPIPRWGLTTTRAAHNAMLGVDRLRAGAAPDHLGFSSDIWHRFVVATGVAHARISGELGGDRSPVRRPALARLVATAELAGLPGYLTAPALARSFASANVVTGRLRLDGGADAIALDLGADSFLLGHHRQRLPAASGGAATTIGVGLGYRYRRELLGPYVQRLAQTHLPGLAVDQHARAFVAGAPLWLRARLRAHYDFAGVHAQAYRTWRAGQPAELVDKAALRRHGYYYGWGPSIGADLEVALPHVAAGGSLGLARYASHEGYDRTQETVTFDVPARDRLLDWDAWLRVGSRGRRAYVEARLEHHGRTSTVGDVTETTRLSTFLLSFGTEQ